MTTEYEMTSNYIAMNDAFLAGRWADARHFAQDLIGWLDGDKFRTIGFASRADSYAEIANVQATCGGMIAKTTTETPFQSLARAARGFFTASYTHNGSTHWMLSRPSPRWVQDLVHGACEAENMPNDRWRNAFIVDALDRLAVEPDAESIDMGTDSTIEELADWLGSHPHRYLRCNIAIANVGKGVDTIQEILRMGQWDELNEVLGHVMNGLGVRLNKIIADEARAVEVEAHVDGLLGLMGP